MSSTSPIRVTAVRGRVTQSKYGAGSKSERDAVFIETASVRYILRRKGGPVFGDTEIIRYVGHQVECDGFVIGTTLLAERVEVIS